MTTHTLRGACKRLVASHAKRLTESLYRFAFIGVHGPLFVDLEYHRDLGLWIGKTVAHATVAGALAASTLQNATALMERGAKAPNTPVVLIRTIDEDD